MGARLEALLLLATLQVFAAQRMYYNEATGVDGVPAAGELTRVAADSKLPFHGRGLKQAITTAGETIIVRPSRDISSVVRMAHLEIK
jgi:hypothetical protein